MVKSSLDQINQDADGFIKRSTHNSTQFDPNEKIDSS